MDSLLSIRGLSVTFPIHNGGFEAVSGVNLDLAQGERLAVMGESGCGKSVLGHAVLGLLEGIATVTGSVEYMGRDLRELNPDELRKHRGVEFALVPQSPSAALDPVLRVGKQIDEMYLNAGQADTKTVKQYSLKQLETVGFTDPEHIYRAYPHQLSGGMCERALIAMGTALSPSLLIADEPTKGLDPESKIDVLRLLHRVSENKSLLMITHDYYAPRICDRVAIMYAGEIVEEGPMEKILSEPLHPYTIGLWAALPTKGLEPIPGSMTRTCKGCRFANRCKNHTNACDETQDMVEVSKGHSVRCCNA